MKIAVKINMILVTITIIGTAIFGSFFYLVAERNLKREIDNHLQTAAHSRTDHIMTYLDLLKSSVAQLSKSILVEEFLAKSKDDPGWIEAYEKVELELNNTKDANRSVKEFMVIDASGKVIASSSEESMGQDKSTDSLFVGGRNGTNIKDPYFSDMHNLPMMSVSAPILNDKTGQFLGVVAARVTMDDLWEITTNTTGLGGTGEVIIANKYGYLITPSRFLKDTFLKKRLETELYKLSLKPTSGSPPLITAPDYRGVTIFGTFERIPDMQWSVLTKIDMSEAYVPVFKLKIAFIFMLIFNPMVALLLGTLFSIYITRPVSRLIRGMKIVGSGDLDYKVGIATKDEIGELSKSFDAMARDLKMKSVSIDTLNKEIDMRKKVEVALEENRVRYQTIFDVSADAIMILIPGGGFADANSATLKLFDCTMNQFRARSLVDLSPEYQPDGSRSDVKAKEMIDAALRDGSKFFEWKHKRLDGKEFFTTVLLTRMEIGGEKLLQASVRDITEQKRAADLIAKAAREWAITFDSMAEGVSIHGPDYSIINVNATLCRMLGKSREKIIGRKCHELFHGKSAPLNGCMLEKAHLSGKEERAEIYEPFLKMWLAVSVSPVRNDKGEIINFVHVVNDITEEKKLRDDLMQSEKIAALGRFAYGAAHEIKNPLGIILGGTEFLQAKLIVADQAEKDTMGMVVEAVRRADAIINALVKYSEAAKFKVERLDPKRLIDDAISQLNPKFAAQHVVVKAEFAAGDLHVTGDAEQLQQALGNVLLNACDAMPSGGKVDIRVRTDSSDGVLPKCVIEISDNGEGVSQENLPKVFEPFFTTRRGRKQLGLGLTLARSIINGAKGSINIDSEKGKGATVKIALPVA